MVFRVLTRAGGTSKITRKNLEKFVKRYATDGKTLDVGCAGGPYAEYFPNRVGIDVNPSPAVDIVADVHDLHMFEADEFDAVLCTEVFEHLHTPHQGIAEMRRVLKPDGMLVLTTRFVYPLHDVPGDYYRFTRYGLEHLLRDFEIAELRPEVDPIMASGYYVACRKR